MSEAHSTNQSMGLSAISNVHGITLYAFEDCIVVMMAEQIVKTINEPFSTIA